MKNDIETLRAENKELRKQVRDLKKQISLLAKPKVERTAPEKSQRGVRVFTDAEVSKIRRQYTWATRTMRVGVAEKMLADRYGVSTSLIHTIVLRIGKYSDSERRRRGREGRKTALV